MVVSLAALQLAVANPSPIVQDSLDAAIIVDRITTNLALVLVDDLTSWFREDAGWFGGWTRRIVGFFLCER